MKEENNNKPIAYNGDDNYIFVSYSHQDNDKALPLISELMKEYKVWYDEGIPYSEEWEPFIIARISHASFFLFLASDNSLSSKMCHNEIEFATKENIPFIIIKLKETTRPLNAYFIDKPIFNLNDYDSVESLFLDLKNIPGISEVNAKKNVDINKYIFKTKYVKTPEEYLDAVREGYCVIEISDYYLEELKVILSDYKDESDDMLYEYAYYLEYDLEEQEEIFNYLVSKNHPKGYYGLAIYLSNNDGEEDQIVDLLKKSAEFNYAPAYYELYYYFDDVNDKIFYLEKAANLEYMEAQYSLGVLFYRGRGIEKSIPKAIYYLEKAAAQGNKQAKELLQKIKG